MTCLKSRLLAAAATGALCTSAAALPLSSVPSQHSGQHSLLENAAAVCNDRGRCYETRRHLYRDHDSDDVYVYGGPRHRHYEGPGVGFRFGFGDRWR